MDINQKDLQVFSLEGSDYQTLLTKKFLTRTKYQPDDPTRIIAQIPGTIVKIMVKEGQSVNPAKCLFIIDAMKMKNKVHSTMTGIISKIHIHEGQIVAKNELLLELEVPRSDKKSKKTERPAEREGKDLRRPRFGNKGKKIKKATAHSRSGTR